MRRIDWLRLGITFLAQIDTEHDEDRHAQELALPVLEALKLELRVLGELEGGRRLFAERYSAYRT